MRFHPFLRGRPPRQRSPSGAISTSRCSGDGRGAMTSDYLKAQGLPFDRRGGGGGYELVVMGTDLMVPAQPARRAVRARPGRDDGSRGLAVPARPGAPELPRYLANTSMTGLSHAYAAFCVASAGYRELFIAAKGRQRPSESVVTGIPNFDDVAGFLHNDFPHRGYVLAATSCLRETLKAEDRAGFIRRCLDLARGRGAPLQAAPERGPGARAARDRARSPGPSSSPTGTPRTWSPTRTCWSRGTPRSSHRARPGQGGPCGHRPRDAARLLPVQNGGSSARRIAERMSGAAVLSGRPRPLGRAAPRPSRARAHRGRRAPSARRHLENLRRSESRMSSSIAATDRPSGRTPGAAPRPGGRPPARPCRLVCNPTALHCSRSRGRRRGRAAHLFLEKPLSHSLGRDGRAGGGGAGAAARGLRGIPVPLPPRPAPASGPGCERGVGRSGFRPRRTGASTCRAGIRARTTARLQRAPGAGRRRHPDPLPSLRLPALAAGRGGAVGHRRADGADSRWTSRTRPTSSCASQRAPWRR